MGTKIMPSFTLFRSYDRLFRLNTISPVSGYVRKPYVIDEHFSTSRVKLDRLYICSLNINKSIFSAWLTANSGRWEIKMVRSKAGAWADWYSWRSGWIIYMLLNQRQCMHVFATCWGDGGAKRDRTLYLMREDTSKLRYTRPHTPSKWQVYAYAHRHMYKHMLTRTQMHALMHKQTID